ncbi:MULTISPECIES: methylated-DNA--[protein]-cysteine S-methyltransferase [Crateriforma]|uniref:Methylated-DNA--protein-cysteine methyltransferase n=1 Tax=Crateriforma conspicua TaxID=2527996 RepID=A0A5C6FQL0_9PLAN|nr:MULTISPECIES: methylated-DNA--[protein]-cysteine S-methyltransferase [Crateriforma]TWU64691.1 Methylated-DNA--protein-cysteine methyltransferase [Crateriforma conspicua]
MEGEPTEKKLGLQEHASVSHQGVLEGMLTPKDQDDRLADAILQRWAQRRPPAHGRIAVPFSLARIMSPLGPMVVAADQQRLILMEFADRETLDTQLRDTQALFCADFHIETNSLIRQVEEQLREYFRGHRSKFTVPCELRGTEFQRSVWEQLLAIPPGTTLSYQELANRVGKPGAQRAVGRANGQNRLAILVPCHRVVRADGKLSGYAGGVWRKRWLLERERQT